jgi:hypothetical protein
MGHAPFPRCAHIAAAYREAAAGQGEFLIWPDEKSQNLYKQWYSHVL